MDPAHRRHDAPDRSGHAGDGEATLSGPSQSRLLVALTLAMAAPPLTSYAAAALSPTLVADLRITAAQFGMFASVSFLSAATFSLLASCAIHRISQATQVAVIFLGATLSFAGLALARDLSWVLVAAVVAGPAHALSNPFTNRVIADRIMADVRTRWMGVKQSGVQCSQALAGLTLPALATAIEWRSSFGMLALLLVASLLWVRMLFRTLGAAKCAPSKAPVEAASLGTISAPPRGVVWAFAAYALFSGTGLQATNVYLPLFARDSLHLSALASGATVAVAGGVGLTARVLWGRTSNLGSRSGSLLLWLALAAAVGVLCLAVAAWTGWAALLWIGVVLHGATAIGSNVIVMVGVLHRVPATQAAVASATVGLGMYLGFALGPLLLGSLLSLVGGFALGWCLMAVTYLCSGAAAARLRPSPDHGG